MKTLENRNNHGATLAQAEAHLRNLEPFHTGTLSAKNDAYLGYVVESYGVVIAVVSKLSARYIYPTSYSYSATTSKHANIVKRAWGLN